MLESPYFPVFKTLAVAVEPVMETFLTPIVVAESLPVLLISGSVLLTQEILISLKPSMLDTL